MTIPSAAGSTELLVNASTALGNAGSMASTGSVQPMTPVELGSTWPALRPSCFASSPQSRSEASTPPGAQTLEILLFTRIAPSVGSESRARPTITGAPGNAFLVNTAAKSGVGLSSAMSVSVIFAGFGASRGTKSKRVVPTRNPAGKVACCASQLRCASREENERAVLGTVSRSERQRRASEADFPDADLF
ncbi:MAG: hypothetical protein BWX86_02485 [Verrucomicrobia bacterium ADurb.Bin122]|nr:MAG: hypothetical protein BWX86_02485 [Verrucomicrobia bacterium ADurb.Bin122]